MRITVLGCGSSMGVPAIKYGWGECDPKNPKNRRTRSSIFIEQGSNTLLIDASPDLRDQLMLHPNLSINGVLFTHGHSDHTNGLCELRPIFVGSNRTLDVFAVDSTMEELKQNFSYLFNDTQPTRQIRDIYKPYLAPRLIQFGECVINGIEMTCFQQNHGYSYSLGFKAGRFAYSTDVSELSEEIFNLLTDNLDVWIVDCLCRGEKRPTHANLATTLEWVQRIRPEKTYLTHMDTSMDYDSLMEILPKNVEPSYDGLVIEI